MPIIVVKRGNLAEHDPWNRHRLAYDMSLWNFSYTYAVLTLPIDQGIDGIKTFENFPVVPVGFPTEDSQVSNKFYVDYLISTHGHDTLPTEDQKDAMDTAQSPSAPNPFTVWNQFSEHKTRHEAGGADELSLSGLSGSRVTINGIIVTMTNVDATPYTILNTDVHLSVNTLSSAMTLNLPAIGSVNHGQKYIIKDRTNRAASNNITVTPNGTDQINNGGSGVSFLLISDSDSVEVIANNNTSNWEVSTIDKGKFKILEINSTTTLSLILADEVVVVCDTDSGGFSVNLPELSVIRSNVIYSILNIGSSGNDVIIDGYSSETIDGELTQAIPDASNARIIPTQNGWFIL